MSKKINVLSLFDGVSCGQIALNKLGVEYDNYYAAEIDKPAISITQKNYPKTIQLGDVYTAKYKELPKIDLIFGGSPCTYWSISKKNRETSSEGIGFDLFRQYVRALEECKPKYFLYENNNSIHQDIKDEISKYLGVQPIMIDSHFLSPQSRKRCYWTNIPNIQKPIDKGILVKDILESNEIWNKGTNYIKNDNEIIWTNSKRNPSTLYGKSVRLGHIGNGGQGRRIYSINGKSVNLVTGGASFYKTFSENGDIIVRNLTPVECERLQTVPDNYTEGFSKTERYKMLGNGWTVDVIAHILSHIPKED
jgi:DNA (cytosine-5)-methyltransferase 3A